MKKIRGEVKHTTLRGWNEKEKEERPRSGHSGRRGRCRAGAWIPVVTPRSPVKRKERALQGAVLSECPSGERSPDPFLC